MLFIRIRFIVNINSSEYQLQSSQKHSTKRMSQNEKIHSIKHTVLIEEIYIFVQVFSIEDEYTI